MTQTLQESIAEVRGFAESASSETLVVSSLKIGEFVRQGDVYIERIATPDNWKETNNRQLAIGSTMGSRHTIDRAYQVRILANPQNGKVVPLSGGSAVCFGPQIIAEDRFTVGHPEHADIDLPAGAYQVRFQVDAHSLQRVKD